jgi:hypothetical protein
VELLLSGHYNLGDNPETVPANIELVYIGKTNFAIPFPQFNAVNNDETTFGNLPRHKFNNELRERGLKKPNMIQHGIYSCL